MKARNDIDAVIARVLDAETSSFVELAVIAELDPGTDFCFANLSNVDFSGIDLSGFNFTGSDLRGASFRGARITGCIFHRAVGVDLTGAICVISRQKVVLPDAGASLDLTKLSSEQARTLLHSLVDPELLNAEESNAIAGFRGLDSAGHARVVGRGGTDLLAVALSAAVRANRCEIYTKADGIYTADPKVVSKARRLARISYEEMLEMASLGAKVLQMRSVALGMLWGLTIFIGSRFDKPDISANGTLICDEEDIVEQHIVTGIAFSRDEAQISVRNVADKPGVAAAIFGSLSEANVDVDMIQQTVSADGETSDITFTVPSKDYRRAQEVIAKSRKDIGYKRIDGAMDIAKVSVIGINIRRHSGAVAAALKALASRNIGIRAITTSEIKFSVLVDAAYVELSVRTLHSLYGLDKS